MKKIFFATALLTAVVGCTKSQYIGKVEYKPIVIKYVGESNTTGSAADAALSTYELGVRKNVKIFNNSTYVFADLQVGVNNVSNGVGTYHGWEVGLANSIDTGGLKNSVYLLKTGISGTKIETWDTGQANYNRDLRLTDSAFKRIAEVSNGAVPVMAVVWQDAINDAQGLTDTTVWKQTALRIFASWRVKWGDSLHIFMPHIQPSFTDYNSCITSLAAVNPSYNHEIQISDLSGAGTLVHWQEPTMKLMSARIVWYIKTILWH